MASTESRRQEGSVEPAVAVRDLAFAYRHRPVLAGVDLEVGRGEIVGLLGPNGAGKSTLVRIASGVLGGYSGSVRIGGLEVREAPRRALARQVAVVPQGSRFAFPFSALEVALMGRHPHLSGLAFESPADVAAARRALERAGALDLAERSIQELSAGERQRVTFARALAQETPVLLLDEATSHLDIRHQVELFDRVREAAEDEGNAVLAVLHDLNLAAEYCHRIVLLAGGGVVAAGPTREVLTYVNLRRVFETDLYVDVNDLTGGLVVSPLPGRVRRRLSRGGDEPEA